MAYLEIHFFICKQCITARFVQCKAPLNLTMPLSTLKNKVFLPLSLRTESVLSVMLFMQSFLFKEIPSTFRPHKRSEVSQPISNPQASQALSYMYISQGIEPLVAMYNTSSSDTSASSTRRLARSFPPDVPQHPLLDPNFPKEDTPLVPKDLAPRGRLNWELPKGARMNLHIMLKLTEEKNKLIDEFHAKVPTIDEVIGEWCEMQGASPTRAGFAKLRAQVSHKASSRAKADERGKQPDDDGDSYMLNMVKNLDSPGRSDLIYLTNAGQDKKDIFRRSRIPDNLRAVDWSDFDGSYVHLADASHQTELRTANPELKSKLTVSEPSMRRKRTPSNLRTTEWSTSEPDAYLFPGIYSPKPYDEAGKAKPLGPFEEFWRDHGGPQGYQAVIEEDGPASTSSGYLSEFQPQWPESMGLCKQRNWAWSGKTAKRFNVSL